MKHIRIGFTGTEVAGEGAAAGGGGGCLLPSALL